MNNATRGTSGQIQPILFDQILISPSLVDEYEAGSASVFSQAIALKGANQESRASDHVPVSAVFLLSDETGGGDGDGVPPPPGRPGADRLAAAESGRGGTGNEWVTIKNVSGDSVELEGWQLRDRADHTVTLSGTIAAGTASLNRCSGARLTTGPGGLRTRKLVPLSRYWYLSSPEVWHDSSCSRGCQFRHRAHRRM